MLVYQRVPQAFHSDIWAEPRVILLRCPEELFNLERGAAGEQAIDKPATSSNTGDFSETEHSHERYLKIMYPLVNVYIAIENGHIYSEFSHETLWFSSSLCKRLPEGKQPKIPTKTWWIFRFKAMDFLVNSAMEICWSLPWRGLTLGGLTLA